MVKVILGLDLGSNSVGWALVEEKDRKASKIIGLGSRIFNKAVEEKTPTPKNQKRREMRLGRRVLQRRTRRKQRMLNYLVSLDLLPKELQGNSQPEKCLNELGDPYELRARALDEQLSPHEFGRILLHLTARRGFLSSKKQIAGDLVDDPDTMVYLKELEEEKEKEISAKNKKTLNADDQTGDAFFAAVLGVRQAIEDNGYRTLGEYLHNLEAGKCKRNRAHEGGYLRTDRAMYQDELTKIWEKQSPYFMHLPDDFMADNKGIKRIIFYQRPLKFKKDRVGRCSLEPKNYRASMARLEVQRFRYLQDINHLKYFDPYSDKELSLSSEQKSKLIAYFENHPKITMAVLKKALKLDKHTKVNLEAKDIKGNITACEIRSVLGKQWDEMNADKQKFLFEDLFTIKKKSALKARLINHWNFDKQTVVKLCLLEFEAGHSNHSLKAINKLLPYLEKGMIYSDARQEAGYGFETTEVDVQKTLPVPPKTANPIVNKGLQELRRVVNAIIQQYGKPDAIRIEMARDLEMNTNRVKDFIKQNNKNKKTNKDAQDTFTSETGKKNASSDDKIKYRLWLEQKHFCIYSGHPISSAQLFSDQIEIDHIVPKSLCLDNSYINKVVCFAGENRFKGQKTPIETWSGDEEKWNQITGRIDKLYENLPRKKYRKYTTHPKKKQFYMRQEDIAQKYGMSAAQLNDTRYISRVAQGYVKKLGCDVSVTKGAIVSEVRYWWGLNNLLGKTNKKERADHRHHAIDAAVISCLGRQFHQEATQSIKKSERTGQKIQLDAPYSNFRAELGEKLEQIIVSHAPQRKLSGSLHEETGANYIAKHGGLVFRKTLNSEFAVKDVNNIVDEATKKQVLAHIKNHGNDLKKAFSKEGLEKLKIGKNPIKRVRILQSDLRLKKSENAEEKLQQIKFGVKNKQGEIFKWMVYGNTHHVEIVRHKETREIKGEFVTMLEAHRRAMTGTKSAKKRGVMREEIIKKEHGKDRVFLMALHINDTVSIKNKKGGREFYRVQMIDMNNNKFSLRQVFSATLKNKNEELFISINNKNFKNYDIRLHRIDAIGRLIND